MKAGGSGSVHVESDHDRPVADSRNGKTALAAFRIARVAAALSDA